MIFREKTPAEKARASDQELTQDSRAVGPQILEMRHKHGAKIEHFLPAHLIRAGRMCNMPIIACPPTSC